MIMQTELVDIASLHLDPANVRRHDRRNLDAIKASLAKFGQQKPVVVNGEGAIVAGNGTVEAARELGWEKIAVVRTDLKGSEAIAYAIADNRTAELAEWDDKILIDALKKLDAGLDGLLGTGFDAVQLAALTQTNISTDELNSKDDASEWIGMPAYESGKEGYRLIVHFQSPEDREKFEESIGLRVDKKEGMAHSTRWPFTERIDRESVNFKVGAA